MGGFGTGLMARAASVAKRGVTQMNEAMVAAAEEEMPQGVSVAREGDDVVIRGAGLLRRYWGSARQPPDMALRQMLLRLVQRRGR